MRTLSAEGNEEQYICRVSCHEPERLEIAFAAATAVEQRYTEKYERKTRQG